MDPVPSQRRSHRPFGKQAGNRRIAHIQPAGEGSEGRQHHPHPVRDETGSAHATPMGGDPGRRVQVAGDLARLIARLRLVHQPQRAQRQGLDHRAGQAGQVLAEGQPVVIALQPDPVAGGGQPVQTGPVVRGHATDGAGIVETVTQQHHPCRVEGRDLDLQPRQGGGAVIGRQHLAAGGIGRALLQMQIGGDQGVVGDHPQRARRPQHTGFAHNTHAQAAARMAGG
tara:strand:+ start:12033 stop:12710 length:678 start_codon:yes stop_codon:yes gene_type:complete